MTVESDLNTLRAFLADFESYLKSETIFWTVSGNLPALTVGGVLLIRRTLAARRDSLSPAQASAFDALDSQAGSLFARWPVNIEKKALKELSSRLNVWAATLEELGEGYARTVTPRVQIELLLALVSRLPEAAPYQSRSTALDARLRARLVAGNFVWDAALAPAFPRPDFWYLYGQPSAKSSA